MPRKNDLIALKGYTPLAAPPLYELKAGEADKVKARVRALLASGPMTRRDLVHLTCHEGRALDGVTELTAAHVEAILVEMASSDEFEKGYGDVTATPVEIE